MILPARASDRDATALRRRLSLEDFDFGDLLGIEESRVPGQPSSRVGTVGDTNQVFRDPKHFLTGHCDRLAIGQREAKRSAFTDRLLNNSSDHFGLHCLAQGDSFIIRSQAQRHVIVKFHPVFLKSKR